MKRLSLILALALLVAACVSDPAMESQVQTTPMSKIVNANVEPAPGFLMVRLAEDVAVEAFEEMTDVALDVELLYPRSATRAKSKMDDWYLLSFDKSVDVKALAVRIAEDERVKRVEYDVIIKRNTPKSGVMPASRPELTRATEYPFDDPELPWQWHYNNDATVGSEHKVGADINLLNAWKYCTGDNSVIVAVIDGGVMYNHRDLADNMWVNEAEKNGTKGIDDDGNGYVDDIHGYNFVSNSGNITADSHGTHVAGTISAVNNNGFSGCGIAGGTGNKDGVRIMSLQIFEGEDGCYSHQIARAFEYAADNGAVLANNSWGDETAGIYTSDKEYMEWDTQIYKAIEYFESNASLEGVIDGGVVLFAAGNESYAESIYPGAYNKYICVSAMAPDYTAASYTNYGPGVNICAPGGDNYAWHDMISSTSVEYAYGEGYEYKQGTSMATPHVTGCAALAVSYAAKTGKKLTPKQLKNLILTSVHDIDLYQKGTKKVYNWDTGMYDDMSLAPYKGKLGTGYIDAHLLLMQMDSTPCLYLLTGEQGKLSLDEYFGDASESLTYQGVEVSSTVKSELGITTTPTIKDGLLNITCSKPGTGRIKVKAIAGGDKVGGDNSIGGMAIEREFELVVRGAVASNGGWL